MIISVDMIDYLKGTAVIAAAIKVTAKDGTVIAICTHTRNLTYNSVDYLAWPVQGTQFQQLQGLNPDNAEFVSVMAEPYSDIKLRGRKWSGASVVYELINPIDLTLGSMFRKEGKIGDLTVRRFDVTSQFRSLAQQLSQPIGEMVMEECIVVELGDFDCGVNLAGNTVDGRAITRNVSVASVANQQVFTISGTAQPNGFYNRGKLVFTSGQNDDLEMHILKSVGNVITLYIPAYFTIAAADTLTVIAGCDRKRATCRDKFANAKRYRGYPDLPGRNKVIKFPG